MKIARIIVALPFAAVGLLLVWGAAILIGNFVFQWAPDKISEDWATTMLFAAIYGAVGLVSAALAAPLLLGRWRNSFVLVVGAAALAAWIQICIEYWRQEPAYLWLLVGIPSMFAYASARLWPTISTRHRNPA